MNKEQIEQQKQKDDNDVALLSEIINLSARINDPQARNVVMKHANQWRQFIRSKYKS